VEVDKLPEIVLIKCVLKIDLERFFFSVNLIMTFEQTTGSRAQVWHGTAKKTSGGLTKSALMMNKHGRIVSRKKHASGKKTIKRLKKLGYVAKKGHFTLFKKGRKGSRKMRGGMAYGGPLSPLAYDGQGVGTSGVNLQFVAGNAG
jgi:hypothetical protein